MEAGLGRKRGEHASRPHTDAVMGLASRTVRLSVGWAVPTTIGCRMVGTAHPTFGREVRRQLAKSLSLTTMRGIAESVRCGDIRRQSKQNQSIASFCRDGTIHTPWGDWRHIKNNEFSRGNLQTKIFFTSGTPSAKVGSARCAASFRQSSRQMGMEVQFSFPSSRECSRYPSHAIQRGLLFPAL